MNPSAARLSVVNLDRMQKWLLEANAKGVLAYCMIGLDAESAENVLHVFCGAESELMEDVLPILKKLIEVMEAGRVEYTHAGE